MVILSAINYPTVNSITRNRLLVGLGVLFLIVIWKVASMIISSENLLPSPEQTVVEFLQVIWSRDSALSITTTVVRGLVGFVIAFLFAMVTGILSGLSKDFSSFIQPFMVTLRATPVVAFILILLIWFDANLVPTVIAFLTIYPILSTNIAHGINDVDSDLMEMTRLYRLSQLERLRSLFIPSISAFLFSGIATAMGFGWRAIIIGEVLSQPVHGIGTRIREAYAYFNVTDVIIWTILAVLVSYFFDSIMRVVEQNFTKWKRV